MLESYWNPHFSVPPESLSPSYTTGPSGSCPKSTTKSGFNVRPPFLGWKWRGTFSDTFSVRNKFYKHWCLQSNPCSSRWDVLHWINISVGMHIKMKSQSLWFFFCSPLESKNLCIDIQLDQLRSVLAHVRVELFVPRWEERGGDIESFPI